MANEHEGKAKKDTPGKVSDGDSDALDIMKKINELK